MLAPIPKFSHMLTQILTRVSTFFRINRPISELFAEVCLNCLQKSAFVQIKISFLERNKYWTNNDWANMWIVFSLLTTISSSLYPFQRKEGKKDKQTVVLSRTLFWRSMASWDSSQNPV